MSRDENEREERGGFWSSFFDFVFLWWMIDALANVVGAIVAAIIAALTSSS